MTKLQILIDGNVVPIDPSQLRSVAEVEPGVYSVLLDGKSVEVRAIEASDGLRVEACGRRLAVEIRNPRDANPTAKTAVGSGRKKISAAMPGKVVRLLVEEGDTVDSGQGLIVVEAMKMQNEMKSPRAGRVTEVLVHDGDTVSAGDTLVVLE
jgi:biotin carboxyl carrier protein